MIIVNGRIACTPFPTTQTKVVVKGGLTHISQKAELTRLDVLFSSDKDYDEGDSIWVRGEACKHTFAKEQYELDGRVFILVPIEMVVAHKRMPVVAHGG